MTLKILVVEDEAVVALANAEIISVLGHTVVGLAESCDEAMLVAAQDPPALALVDIRIRGGIDGIETARRLRERFGCPFIFVTGQSDAATFARAQEVDPSGYLHKPFTPDQLDKAIRKAMRTAIRTEDDNPPE